jgi:hypothetical protein
MLPANILTCRTLIRDYMLNSSFFRVSALLFLAASMVGCATNQGIVKLGSDSYTLYKEDHAGIFGNATSLRNEVIGEANTFAENQGKIALPIAAKTHHTTGRPADWETFEYQFRLIDKSDHTTMRTHLIPGSDVVVDDTGKVAGAVETNTQPEKSSDVYGELTKLDELRKKGIISEAEFEAQKKKILNRN